MPSLIVDTMEYDVREGKGPLEKLVELLTEEEEDFAEMLEDVFADDEAMQAGFRKAVEALAQAAGPVSGSGEDDGEKASCHAAVREIVQAQKLAVVPVKATEDEEPTAAEMLRSMLPQSLEAQLAQANEELAQLRAQLDGSKKA